MLLTHMHNFTGSISNMEINNGTIDLKKIDNGIYFIKIISTNGASKVEKLFVIK